VYVYVCQILLGYKMITILLDKISTICTDWELIHVRVVRVMILFLCIIVSVMLYNTNR